MAELKNHKTDLELPLVSVIIPFYNDFKFLEEALRSCLDNTYPHIEILIVDDGSQPALTLEKLNIRQDKGLITIHRNPDNKGPGYSRNIGINFARGEYIAFLDADDVWQPTILQKQMDLFLTQPDIVWVYANGHYLVDEKLHRKPNSRYHGFPGGLLPSGKDVNAYHLRGYNYHTFSSNAFKKRALVEVGLFNETLGVSEDWDLFVRMAERFPSGVKAISESLMIYRVNNKGRHFVNRRDYVKVNVGILERMYRRQGLLEKRKKDFERAVAMIYQRAGIQRLNACHNREAQEYLFHSKCQPLNFEVRMTGLRVLSFLPPFFYKTAVKIYDRI